MSTLTKIVEALTPSFTDHDRFRKVACLFAGLGHLQPLLLVTTNANYLLDRFCMERCCSSEYISRIVTSIIFMEILSIIVVRIVLIISGTGLATIIDLKSLAIWEDPDSSDAKQLVEYAKGKEEKYRGYISTIILLLISLGYAQILYAFTTGGRKGHMHWFYASLLVQHFLNSLIAGSIGFWEVGLALWYLMAIPVGPIVVFFYQLYIHSWIRNNGPRYPERLIVEYQIWLALLLSGIATACWTAGYVITYSTAELNLSNPTASSENNITVKEDTRNFRVYTVTSGQHATISSTSGAKTVKVYSITLSSGSGEIVYPGIPITVKSEVEQPVEAKVEATVAGNSVKVEIKKYLGAVPKEILWSTSAVTGDSVTISKITLESSDLNNIQVTKGDGQADTGTPHTIKGYICYPENGYYISGLSNTSTGGSVSDKLWNTTWDGGECYYAEYYKNESGTTSALLMLHISGGIPSVRYYGTKDGITSATGWKKIDTETKFREYLKELKTTGTLSTLATGTTQASDESKDYNTKYSEAFSPPTLAPLIMQGLSVGAVGSIFPNLIPKTLTCPKTTRTLTVINMFLVTVPHIFNVMLGDMDLLSRIGVGTPWEGGFHTVWSLYLIYILAILFAIFNIHYPEWRLSSFLRNNTWMVFLMILFTDVLNESFNAISRAGICSQRSAHTPPG